MQTLDTRRSISRASRRAALLVLAAAGVASCSSPLGVTCARYAAPQGADSAAGSRASPFRSPGRLAAALAPGETGCLRGGTYTAGRDGYVLVVRRGGEADAPIIVRSAPGERARLTGTVMITRGAAHVHLTHADIVGAAGQNTVKVYGRDIVLEHLDITNEHRGGSCVILGSGRGGRTVRPIVRRSFLHACGAPADGNKDHGIYAGRAVDAEIVDNLLVDPAAYAIQLYPDAQRAHVEHNVIVGGPDSIRGGIVIGGDDTATANGNVVERNVIAGTATAAVDAYWEDAVGEGNVIRANCIWEGSGDFTAEGIELRDNLVADPRFRDPEAGDYRLHPAGPCVDRVGFLGHPSTLAR